MGRKAVLNLTNPKDLRLNMLELTDRPLEPVIAALAQLGVTAGYLVPTPTGLDKSILDAHAGLRDYLRLSKFHDYQQQEQGTTGKRIVKGFFVNHSGLEPTQVSLYRPDSKNGDPRIWVYGLKERVLPGNLLGIFAFGAELYVANLSDPRILSPDGQLSHHLLSVVNNIVKASRLVADELLDKLRGIASQGWIPTMRAGPTGVGYTLESKLGIKANSSKAPDYKGIEIKAGRSKPSGQTSRTTLFSKTPDWKRSTIRNGLGLLDTYGYHKDGRLQLYGSLNDKPNPQGHYLDVPTDESVLNSMHVDLATGNAEKVLLWDMEQLRKSLAKKHKETFWVKALSRKSSSGVEEFQYTDVIHTQGPLLANVADMFRLGRIELDYLLHEEFGKKGRRRARDHGYLFKMWQTNLSSLFPPAQTYPIP